MSKRIGSKVRKNKGRWKHSVQAIRREVAEERNKAYSKLTTLEKIAKLDFYGHTAAKQRAKLQKQLEKENDSRSRKTVPTTK